MLKTDSRRWFKIKIGLWEERRQFGRWAEAAAKKKESSVEISWNRCAPLFAKRVYDPVWILVFRLILSKDRRRSSAGNCFFFFWFLIEDWDFFRVICDYNFLKGGIFGRKRGKFEVGLKRTVCVKLEDWHVGRGLKIVVKWSVVVGRFLILVKCF